MLKEQKEQLSSLMDGEQCGTEFVDAVSKDDALQQCWHRYHIVRDVMQGKLHDCSLSFDISEKVAQEIALEDLAQQPAAEQVILPNVANLFWIKAKDIVSKVSQVGLAACVTLGIIAGVQYQQNSTSDNQLPVLNTVPVGVNIAPVGGMNVGQNNQQEQHDTIESQQYNKIRLLVQDYELQRRLNAQ